MGRPVSGQPTGLFTQLEEIDIDFRVSGLPHAVVEQAENFRVRELVKKIESHPHREALQADLQQNNFYNPFSDESKAMARGMGSQGMSLTGGGGLARVCVCANTQVAGVAPQGGRRIN